MKDNKITKYSIVELTKPQPATKYQNSLPVGTKLYVWKVSKKHNNVLVNLVDKDNTDRHNHMSFFVNISDVKTSDNQPKNPVKVNDIFYSSWGYEQTNIDFFQVVKVMKKSVEIVPINQNKTYTGPMMGQTTPIKDSYNLSEKRRVNVKLYNGTPSFKVYSFANAYPYKNEPLTFTEWH